MLAYVRAVLYGAIVLFFQRQNRLQFRLDLGFLRAKLLLALINRLSRLDLLEDSIRQDAELVKLGSRKVAVSRDSEDYKVIETALIGKCQYIVSADNDLLVLRKHGGIKILKPVDFLRLFTK